MEEIESLYGFLKSFMDSWGIHGLCSSLQYLSESPPIQLHVERSLQKALIVIPTD